MMERRSLAKSIVIMGLACFAMFFGAGNLIFPPYLGFHTGKDWLIGFLFYIIFDAGMASLCLVQCAGSEGGFDGIMGRLGRVSKLVIAINALCLGPLIVAPRTAATTFSLSVEPLLPGVSSWVVSFIFFVLVTFLCLNPSRVVDTVGSVLSPVLVVGLIVLIARGVFVLRGPIHVSSGLAFAVKQGTQSGFQTMDMMGAALFYPMLVLGAQEHKIEAKDKKLSFTMAALIASVGLFLVYMGLCYLGACSQSIFSWDLTQAELLVAITELILGKAGKILLAVIVLLACLTTAVGVISSFAKTMDELFSLKEDYKKLMLGSIFLSFLLSNIGLSNIIEFAAPLLELIYPVIITCVMLSLSRRAPVASYRLGSLLGFAAAAWVIADGLTRADLGSSLLPLTDMGMGFLIPALIGAAAGAFIKNEKKN